MVTSFIHTTYGIENWKHDTHLTCLWWILIRRTVSFRQEGLTSMLQSLFATVEWSQWTIGDCQPHPGPYRQVTSIRPQSNLGVVNVPATRKKKDEKVNVMGCWIPSEATGFVVQPYSTELHTASDVTEHPCTLRSDRLDLRTGFSLPAT